MMRKTQLNIGIGVLVIVVTIVVGLFFFDGRGGDGSTYYVGIMQHAENPILDQVRQGFLDALDSHESTEGEELDVL